MSSPRMHASLQDKGNRLEFSLQFETNEKLKALREFSFLLIPKNATFRTENFVVADMFARKRKSGTVFKKTCVGHRITKKKSSVQLVVVFRNNYVCSIGVKI